MIPGNRENALPDQLHAHAQTQRHAQFVDYKNDSNSQSQQASYSPPTDNYSPSISNGGLATLGFSTPSVTSDMTPSPASGFSPSFAHESSSNTPHPKPSKGNDRAEQREPDSPPASAPSRRSVKSHVSRACLNCRNSHLACDQSRPCKRCVQSGKAALCTDLDHKRRGRPKLAGRGGVTRNHGKFSSAVPTVSSSSSSPVSSGEMDSESNQASPPRKKVRSPIPFVAPAPLATPSAPQSGDRSSGTALASLLAQPSQSPASFLPSPTSTSTSTPNMVARHFPSPNFPRSEHQQKIPHYNLPTPTTLPSSFESTRTAQTQPQQQQQQHQQQQQQHPSPPNEVVFYLTHDLTFSRLLRGDPRTLFSIDSNLLIGRTLPSIVHDADRSLLNATLRGSSQHLHVLPPFGRCAPVLVTVSIEPVSHPRSHEFYVCLVKRFQHGVLTAHEMRQQWSGSAQQHQQELQMQQAMGQQKQWNPAPVFGRQQGRGLPGFSR